MSGEGLFANLPAVDEVLRRNAVAVLVEAHGAALVTGVVREVVDRARGRIQADDPRPTPDEIADMVNDEEIARRVKVRMQPQLGRVINATGIVLHTNLGRAPLAPAVVEAMASAAGYTALEFDLDTGRRGARAPEVERLLRELLGCEDAMVVNNCAAAVLLALKALADGREVVVSRGEEVEIGGGFRVPDIIAASGCRLVEVGTTNRTRVDDYRRAATEHTAALLKVHRSNFAIVGFTQEASVEELRDLGEQLGVPLVYDLGSGLLLESLATGALSAEVSVEKAIRAGVDLVTFSGDKLLGGPQAGILVGRRTVLDPIRAHPMARALRCDKVTLAGLEATLKLYRDGRSDEVVVLHRIGRSVPDLTALAEELRRRLADGGVEARVEPVEDPVGGGSAPTARLPGVAVRIDGPDPEGLARALRAGDPPVVVVVREGALWAHLRSVGPDDLEALAGAVLAHYLPPTRVGL